MEGQTGFNPDGHGFQNYKENDDSQGAYSSGFKDESEFSQKGFQPDGHGFQNYKGDDSSQNAYSSGFKDTSNDPFQPQRSTAFGDDNESSQKGYQPDNHGFQNYKGGDDNQTAYSTGFQDTSATSDPFKPQRSTAFGDDNEPSQKGYQPDGHGFQNYKGSDNTQAGDNQTAYSTGFKDDSESSQKGFQPDGHGFQNYKESGNSQEAYSSGFQDTS